VARRAIKRINIESFILKKAPKSLHQHKLENKQPIDLIVTSDEPYLTPILVNTEEKEKEREQLFTIRMQVKNIVLILDTGSQRKSKIERCKG